MGEYTLKKTKAIAKLEPNQVVRLDTVWWHDSGLAVQDDVSSMSMNLPSSLLNMMC